MRTEGAGHQLERRGAVIVADDAARRHIRIMRVTYDPEAKAAYIYLKYPLGWGEAARTIPGAAPGINLDFDADGHLIGIELLSPNRLHPDLMAIAVRSGDGDETP